MLLVAIVLLHPFSTAKTEGKLRVDFLDVGQGDAALVTMPDGTTLLVDGGGRPRSCKRNPQATLKRVSNGTLVQLEAVVSEYLWWRGLERVDYVMATMRMQITLKG